MHLVTLEVAAVPGVLRIKRDAKAKRTHLEIRALPSSAAPEVSHQALHTQKVPSGGLRIQPRTFIFFVCVRVCICGGGDMDMCMCVMYVGLCTELCRTCARKQSPGDGSHCLSLFL